MIHFTKMHGCGNDYIYIDCRDGIPADISSLAVAMSRRHFSVGGDGVVCICRSETADAKMRMFNADGSEGRMCGNAIRCVGKYLYDNGVCRKENISIETLSGIKRLKLTVESGRVKSVRVDMGKAEFDCAKIPVRLDGEAVGREVFVAGETRRVTCVSMGNPHCVVFCDEVDSLNLPEIGVKFERDPLFPEGVNTEFVRVIDPRNLQMRVWERGSGETYACGTGACATVAAAVRCGCCREGEQIAVHLIGGELKITYRPDGVTMEGGAVKVYEGVYDETER